MTWLWITLAVLIVLILLGASLCLAAPLDLRVLVEQYDTVAAEGELHWGWGAVVLRGAWWPGVLRYRLRVLGREVPHRPIDAVVGRLVRWWRERQQGREPFDWRALLTRERVAAELRALRVGAERFEEPGQVGQLGVETVDLVLDLGASLGLWTRVDLRVGLEDPFAMGMVWAAGAVASGLLPPGSFTLRPAFDGEVVEGYAELGGRLRPIPLAWLGGRFLLWSHSGRRCLRAAWSWWWYSRALAEAEAR